MNDTVPFYGPSPLLDRDRKLGDRYVYAKHHYTSGA